MLGNEGVHGLATKNWELRPAPTLYVTPKACHCRQPEISQNVWPFNAQLGGAAGSLPYCLQVNSRSMPDTLHQMTMRRIQMMNKTIDRTIFGIQKCSDQHPLQLIFV